MTINAAYQPSVYMGDGVSSFFPITFLYQLSTDLVVQTIVVATNVTTTLVLGTDYNITPTKNSPAATGSLVLLLGPLNSGTTLSIGLAVPITQLTHWVPNDPNPSTAIENAVDKLTMLSQAFGYNFGRSIYLRPFDTDGSGAFDARNNRITRLGNAQVGSDAVSLTQLQTYITNILTTGSAFAPTNFTFNGDGTTTSYPITGSTIAAPSSYFVMIQGVVQTPFTDYSINLSTIPPTLVFAVPPPASTVIQVRVLGFAVPLGGPGIGFDASIIVSGIFPPARLGTGTPGTDGWLRYDNVWTNTLVGTGGGFTMPGDATTLADFQNNSIAGIRVTGGVGGQAGYRFAAGNALPWAAQWVYDDSIGAISNQVYGGPQLNQFYNTGDVQLGNAGLYYKRSTNYVGIGTNSPQFTLDVNGTVRATNFLGTLDASQIISGIFNPLRLGGGSPTNITFLRGDGVWAIPPSGGGGGSTTTVTTGTFTIAAVGSPQTFPVASTTALAVNQFIYVTDGVNTITAQITAIAGLNVTATTTLINGGLAGNTMASGAVVAQSAPTSNNFNVINLPNTTGPTNGVIFFGTTPFMRKIPGAGPVFDVFLGGGGSYSSSGTDNLAIGRGAMTSITSGNSSIAIGANALHTATNPTDSTAVGAGALFAATGATFFNTAFGVNALNNLTIGSTNVGLGAYAGYSQTTLNQGVFVGAYADNDAAVSDGAMSIQNIIFGIGNSAQGPSISTGRIGIGRKLPQFKLDIAGNVNADQGYLGAAYAETTLALGTVGATATANFATAAYVTATLTANTTTVFAFTAPANPNTLCYLKLTPASNSAYTLPGTVLGSPPPIGANALLLTFKWDGTNYFFLNAAGIGIGVFPAGGTSAKFLRGDNTWATQLLGGFAALGGFFTGDPSPLGGNPQSALFRCVNDGTNEYGDFQQINNVTTVTNRYWDFSGQLIVGPGLTPLSTGVVIDSTIIESLYSDKWMRTAQGVRSKYGFWGYFPGTFNAPPAAITHDTVDGPYMRLASFANNVTCTLGDAAAVPTVFPYGYATEKTIEVVAPGAFTITFASSAGAITWLTGSQPVASTTGTTIYRFIRRQNVTGWVGYAEPNASAAYTDAQARVAVAASAASTPSITVTKTNVAGDIPLFAWTIAGGGVTNAMLAGGIAPSNLAGYPSNAALFLNGAGNWTTPGGGGGSTIQMQSVGSNFGTAGQFTTYNFGNAFTLSGVAGSTLNVIANTAAINPFITWQIGGSAANPVGVPVTAVNFSSGVSGSFSAGTLTLNVAGGGGSFSPATSYNWTAPQTFNGRHVFNSNGQFPGALSANVSQVMVNDWYPNDGVSPDASVGLKIETISNVLVTGGATSALIPLSVLNKVNAANPAQTTKFWQTNNGNLTSASDPGGVYFSINTTVFQETAKMNGPGTSDAMWLNSMSPHSAFVSSPDANGVTHSYTAGTVRIGELNYGNHWADFGFQDTRGGTQVVAGLEFFPAYVAGSRGGAENGAFNVQWGICLAGSTTGGVHWTGILLDQSGVAPGGLWINAHGNSTQATAIGAALNIQQWMHTGINFAGNAAGGVPSAIGSRALIVNDASGRQPAITLGYDPSALSGTGQSHAICFVPSNGAGTGVYIEYSGGVLRATKNGGTTWATII